VTSAVLAHSCTRTHVVKSGEICDEICQVEGVSKCVTQPTYDVLADADPRRSSQLMMFNPEINDECTNLMPGQVLCLAKPNEDCRQVQTVEPNDTCDIYGVDPATFYSNNWILDRDCTNLYIGMVCFYLFVEYDPNIHTPIGCLRGP
jgi:hypothetical protein